MEPYNLIDLTTVTVLGEILPEIRSNLFNEGVSPAEFLVVSDEITEWVIFVRWIVGEALVAYLKMHPPVQLEGLKQSMITLKVTGTLAEIRTGHVANDAALPLT